MIYLFIFLFSLNIEKRNVKIFINEHKDVYLIHDLGVSIEHLYDDYIETHLDDEMIKKLQKIGYRVEEIKEKENYFTNYHNYEQMVAKIDSIEQEYPNLAKKIIIGYTQQGRTIWALKISDNVNLIEPEPRVRFVGIIHGDEPIGCELTLYLADTLTRGYNSNSYITNLVNNREIYLIPIFNVDGMENASRYYANGIDPNRNFPVPDGSIGGDGTYSVFQETQAFINWSDTMNFVLSVTFHSGAKIVNYQWDYTNQYPPFYQLIRKIAIGYAIRNDTIFYSPTPYSIADSGTVRGYVWYPAPGSLQDWAYHWTGCIDLTVELNNNKWPNASKLPVLWECNRNSMLWIIEQSGKGLSGIVKDSLTGIPIRADYQIQGVNKIFKTGNNGEFSRPLIDGNYTITFSKENYIPKTISGIPVSFDTTTFIEVFLLQTTGIDDTTKINIFIRNPFRKDYTFQYFIPESGYYDLLITDISGRIIKSIFKEKFLYKGLYPDKIEDLPTGIYFISLISRKEKALKKIIYLR